MLPTLDDLLTMIGEAGRRLSEIEASEGAAGNISICARWPLPLESRFERLGPIELPQPVPELAGAVFLVTGSGRRLREILDDPLANLAAIVVEADGKTGLLHASPRRRFERVTSEFNSHLAVHYDQLRASDAPFHALVHAQPLHLTYLSHIHRYQNADFLNRRLLRWQPETIIQMPEGIGVLPFLLPGSTALMQATTEALRRHRIVLWSKHGVMARSEISVKRAADKVEYAETAARYEYLNLCADEPADGLTAEEIRAICAAFDVKQEIF